MSLDKHDGDFVAPAGPAPRSVDPSALARLDGRYVHKVKQRNVLIARVDRVAGDDHTFEGELTPDWTHPFFFEHPLDHVPAMYLVEAGRQFAMGIAHLHLGVPTGVVFITTSFRIEFTEFAEVNGSTPIIVRATVGDLVYRKKQLRSMEIDGTYTQGESVLGKMGGSCAFYPRELYIELRDWYSAKE